jgi:uncharacterized DUF497 family protein
VQYNFEWDPEKAKINFKKHKVNFEHSATIFKDPQAISIFDDDHSEKEDRWVSMGLASNGVLLIVHHTYKQIDDQTIVIRIISSRKATKNEEGQYMEGLK